MSFYIIQYFVYYFDISSDKKYLENKNKRCSQDEEGIAVRCTIQLFKVISVYHAIFGKIPMLRRVTFFANLLLFLIIE